MAQMHGAMLDTLACFYEAEAAYLVADVPDFSRVSVTLDPECVIYQPASLPYGGVWRGHDGFDSWMRAFCEQWASLEVSGTQLYPSGDDVIVSQSHVYATSRRSGVKADWPLLQFLRFRNGRILELRPFYWDTAGLLSALRSEPVG